MTFINNFVDKSSKQVLGVFSKKFSPRGKTPPTSVLDMTLNNLMMRLQ